MTDQQHFSDQAGIRAPAGRSVERAVRAGAAAYVRDRDLQALIRLDPLTAPVDDQRSAEGIVARLERALRGERNRARSGHWTYDLNRHIALRQAHRAEVERLDRLRRAAAAQASVNTVSSANTGSRNAADQAM